MSNKEKRNNIILLILHVFIAASTMVLVLHGVAKGAGIGQVGRDMTGLGYLKAFTVLSNILNGTASFVMAVFAVNNLFSGKYELPRWAVVFQFVAACAVGLTFITVLVFLAPMQAYMGNGYFRFFSGDMFFFHFLNPVLSVAAFMFLERRHTVGKREQLFALIPTFIYSWLYFFEVVVSKKWDDFYGFTFGGRDYLFPVSFVVMYGGTWLISCVLSKIHAKNISESAQKTQSVTK